MLLLLADICVGSAPDIRVGNRDARVISLLEDGVILFPVLLDGTFLGLVVQVRIPISGLRAQPSAVHFREGGKTGYRCRSSNAVRRAVSAAALLRDAISSGGVPADPIEG